MAEHCRHITAGSAEGSWEDRVAEDAGEGGFFAVCVCSAFVSRVGHSGLGTGGLCTGTACCCLGMPGVAEERSELIRDEDGGQEWGIGGENTA